MTDIGLTFKQQSDHRSKRRGRDYSPVRARASFVDKMSLNGCHAVGVQQVRCTLLSSRKWPRQHRQRPPVAPSTSLSALITYIRSQGGSLGHLQGIQISARLSENNVCVHNAALCIVAFDVGRC